MSDRTISTGQESPRFRTAQPITVRRLIAELELMTAKRPEIADWPVHILDMDDGDDNDDPTKEAWVCLVTTVETDKFSEEQGWVVSLCAEREVRVRGPL